MNIDEPLALLGGMTPRHFMKHYWQRKPLLIRQAIPGFRPSLSISDIRQLVQREEVESRLVQHDDKGWHMKTGPFSRLPAQRRPNWTVLAQNVDAHDDATAELMHQFRFISDARLDDVMISIAGDGGGVGPHFDSYDVFLLQGHGKRHWRISTQKDLRLEPGLPLKILADFQPEEDYVLEPGDMLYLPPHVAHDGVALGDCMTLSIGFRAANQATLACGLLEAAGDQIMARLGQTGGLYGDPALPGARLDRVYTDRGAKATQCPAELPDQLIEFTLRALQKVRFDDALATRFLGQWLTEPSRGAAFEPNDDAPDLSTHIPATGQLRLDRCSRMLYRGPYLFINGEATLVKALPLLKQLADTRALPCNKALRALGTQGLELLTTWLEDGWLHYQD